MYCVEKGGDRQALHEAIRKHSVETAKEIKLFGKDNEVLKKIVADPTFGLTEEEAKKILADNSYFGCAESQTEEFLKNTVKPILEQNKNDLDEKVGIKV